MPIALTPALPSPEFSPEPCASRLAQVPGGVRLFACGTQGKLKHFPELNVEGGKTEDLPSQGKACHVAARTY